MLQYERPCVAGYKIIGKNYYNRRSRIVRRNAPFYTRVGFLFQSHGDTNATFRVYHVRRGVRRNVIVQHTSRRADSLGAFVSSFVLRTHFW